MKELFIPYELALLAKEKGFNEECLADYRLIGYMKETIDLHIFGKYYPESDFRQSKKSEILCSAPLYQQIINWILNKLEKIHFDMSIRYFSDGSGYWIDLDYKEIHFDNMDEAIEKILKLI